MKVGHRADPFPREAYREGMGLYRFHFHAEEGADPSVVDGEYANDGAAVEAAFAALRDRRLSIAVEVFAGDRLLTRMERPGDDFLKARSGLHGLR